MILEMKLGMKCCSVKTWVNENLTKTYFKVLITF